MTWLKRKVEVPDPEQTVELEAVQLWRVDWISRYDSWHGSTQKESEVFTSEEDARTFEQTLKNAHKVLKNAGSETRVTLTKYNGEK